MPDLTNTAVIELGAHLTTSISDDGWEIYGPGHIACWESAQCLLSGRSFEHEGKRVEIEVDWSPVIGRLQKNHRIMQRLMQRHSIRFPQSPVRVEFRSRITNDIIEEHMDFRDLISYFMYDFFLIMNIAYPASCDFYNAKFVTREKYQRSTMNLSNYYFEISILNSREGKWPKIGNLPLSQVISWFSVTRPGVAMVPRSRIEKVLFAMLHIAIGDASPTTIVWIFYALEALFDTKIGENFRSLVDRIGLLLSSNAKELAFLKKNLRQLYDLRSAFVHGGLDVIHPFHGDRLDKSVDGLFERILFVTNFGFQLILSSVQEIIRRGWIEPEFKEVLGASKSCQASAGPSSAR